MALSKQQDEQLCYNRSMQTMVLMAMLLLLGTHWSSDQKAYSQAQQHHTPSHPGRLRKAIKEVRRKGNRVFSDAPAFQCTKSVVHAMQSCLEDGCSVETLLELEDKLAKDEGKVESAMHHVQQMVKEHPVEAAWSLSSYDDLLHHLKSIHAQLHVQESVAPRSALEDQDESQLIF